MLLFISIYYPRQNFLNVLEKLLVFAISPSLMMKNKKRIGSSYDLLAITCLLF
jgi:hypothetical protein